MSINIEFGDCFNWESCDEIGHRSVDVVYIDEIEEDPSIVAEYIQQILSEVKDAEELYNFKFKDHGDVNGIHIYTFTTDEYIFICHYTYADEHQAYLVRHQNMSALTEYTVGETFGVTEEAIYYDENGM